MNREMKSSVATMQRPDELAGPSPSSITAAQKQKQAELASYAETMYFGAAGELAYARNIEITNGRYVPLVKLW